MTRDQKKQYVNQLYTEDKNFKEIAQLTRMSFRDISTIIKEHKEEIERKNGQLKEREDIKSKSKTTQAIKMFSEGQTPTQVVIELDLPPEEVRKIYRQYLGTGNMYDFLQVYDQIIHSGRYSISSFLRLHKILNDLGMGEQQIINVLNLANHNQLEYLQDKVEHLANDVNMLEEEKTKCTNHLAILNSRRDECMKAVYTYESDLAQLREEIYYRKNGSRLRPNRIQVLPYNEPGIYPIPRRLYNKLAKEWIDDTINDYAHKVRSSLVSLPAPSDEE